MFASEHFVESDDVLRTLIVGLGGFTTVSALVLACWNLWAWRRNTNGRAFASLLLGLQLLAFAGLASLGTDHIRQHLLNNQTAAWQLWLSLASFTLGAVSLVALLSVRFDRSTTSPKP